MTHALNDWKRTTARFLRYLLIVLVHLYSTLLLYFPCSLAQTILYSLVTYALVSWEWTAAKFLWYLLFMFLTLFLFTYYGIMAIAITPSVQLAQVTSVLFYFLWNLFSGFLIPQPVSDTCPIWDLLRSPFGLGLRHPPSAERHVCILADIKNLLRVKMIRTGGASFRHGTIT